MANYSGQLSVHKTLVANTADTVTLGPEYDYVDVYNRSGTAADMLTVLPGAVAPAALANDTYVIPAGQSRRIPTPGVGDDNTVITLISTTATPYSVIGVPVT